MDQLIARFNELVADPYLRAVVIFGTSLLVAIFIRQVLVKFVLMMTSRTSSEIDDDLIFALRRPVIASVVLLGIWWGLAGIVLAPVAARICFGVLKTLAVFIWTGGAMNVGRVFLEAMSRNHHRLPWIQPKTLPLLQICWKVFIVSLFVYFLLLAWKINPTSWLASAGVMGIAIGFAAKDTLANLFAGVFIVADAPYQIGDFVVLDNNLRGEIREIGIRSSRIQTRDDIEVTVPNAVIANGQIINETGGPNQKMRVRVKVGAAYGSDIDLVRRTLIECTTGAPHVVLDPAPRVRFRQFGDSGLLFELLAWIEAPVYRGRVIDDLNSKVYKAFRQAEIEIPYPKQDVYIRALPETKRPAGEPTGRS
jgi:MscS family membrane protein